MKQKSLGAAVLAVFLGLAYGAYRAYFEVEVKGCKKIILSSLQRQFGEIPADVKDKVLEQIDTECRSQL